MPTPEERDTDNTSAAPLAVVADLLAHFDPDQIEDAVDRLVADDATYVSVAFDNPELKQILPWAGTSTGPQAFLDNFAGIATRWEMLDFKVTDMFGSGEDVAVFGEFTYRSFAVDKTVRSPFAIHVKVRDSKIQFFQFLEDSFATSRSFSPGGTWTIKNVPDEPEFEV